MAVVLAGCLCFVAVSCSALSSAWPVVLKCAPSVSSVLAQVETILLAGGDFQSALLALGKALGKDGLSLVVCAARELADKWSTPSLSVAHGPELARARAFLAETSNQ